MGQGPSGAREIVGGQFERRDGMGQQPAFGDGADAPVAVAERFQHPGFRGPWLEPEPGFERSGRDDAFDRTSLVHKGERYTAAIRGDLRFSFDRFHG